VAAAERAEVQGNGKGFGAAGQGRPEVREALNRREGDAPFGYRNGTEMRASVTKTAGTSRILHRYKHVATFHLAIAR
jgi:hypothetical protein